MPTPTRGATAAQEIADAQKASGAFRIRQLTVKEGDAPAVVRPLTDLDDLLSFSVHQFAPTKAQPASFSGKWPQSMWAVCQADRSFRLRDPASEGRLLDEFEDGYGKCYLHEALAGKKDQWGRDQSAPAAQVFGLAVVRKQVADPTTKKIVGFADDMIEWKDKEGKVHSIPHLVVISQKWGNFWSAFAAAGYLDGMITNKDFAISRKDKTDYNIAAITTTPDHRPGTPSWKVYEDALALTQFDLWEWLISHSTPDHYARWFVPGQEPSGGYGRKSDGDGGAAGDNGAPPAAGTVEIDQAQMEEFAAKLAARGAR